MSPAPESLPSDLAAAHAMILAERAARVEAEAVAARAQALSSSTQALIAHLKLQIEKLRRELYGSRSERTARLLEQMELQLEDLEASDTVELKVVPSPNTTEPEFPPKVVASCAACVSAPNIDPFRRPTLTPVRSQNLE